METMYFHIRHKKLKLLTSSIDKYQPIPTQIETDEEYTTPDVTDVLPLSRSSNIENEYFQNLTNLCCLSPNGTNITNGTEKGCSDQDWHWLYTTTIPIMVLFCLVTIVVNMVIVCSVMWIRRPLSPTLRFSISLAGADAYASLVVGIGLLINSFLPQYNICVHACFSLVLEAFRLGGIVVTVLHLLALAINHYIGIVRPLHYTYTITPRATNSCIIILWLSPIAFFFIYFLSVEGQGFQSDNCSFEFFKYLKFRSIICSLFFTPLILMFFIYAHIFFIIRRHQANRERYQVGQDLSRNVKAIITTILILGTCIIGWVPGLVLLWLFCNDCIYQFQNVMRKYYIMANILVIMKSMVDPIIYAARMKDIKIALRRMGASCCGSCMPPFDPQLGLTSDCSQHKFSLHHARNSRGTILYRVKSFHSHSTPNGSLRGNGSNGHLPNTKPSLRRHNTTIHTKRTDTIM